MKKALLLAALLAAAVVPSASGQDWDDDGEDWGDEEAWYEEDVDLSALAPPPPDVIDVKVCNKSGYNALLAINFMPVGGTGFTSKGWFRVNNGECNYIAKTKNANFYIYGETEGANRSWRGSSSFCVEYPGPFTLSLNGGHCASHQHLRDFKLLSASKFGEFVWTLDP